MNPWQIMKAVRDTPNPLIKFEARIGGTSATARRELLFLGEFEEGLDFFHYRYLMYRLCVDQLTTKSAQSAPISAMLQQIGIDEKSPESIATWFEFESLLAVTASLLDRLGNILGWSYPGISAGRLDTNIKKLPSDSNLPTIIEKHIEWVSYLADLRNTSMHRLLVSSDPVVKIHQGKITMRLPDLASIRSRNTVDPRQLTFAEHRTMDDTVKVWHDNLVTLVDAVFENYFALAGR